ncbi:hypothetical protein BS47DRAFT_1374215 [Hydnum rufescens UP504]|uniref:Inositol-1-monophosphatase n=1 Tax=Hydnum rufescens UP504 TaxID=1448309 RepID=A0A9P6DPS1_9AGAM|nr:hypothetical protein BS47DRAFT_1374215 [Hydnum rufescens UP504]
MVQLSIAELEARAGNIILDGSKAIRHQTVAEKKNAVDLVTEWDGEIRSAYPAFEFIGEESFSSGHKPTLTDNPTFCVDPIDGTTNFVHGFPFACISLGLIYLKKPVLGVIFNPFLDQMYSALRGHGAYLNQSQRLPFFAPAPFPSLSSALIGVEYGSDRSNAIMDKKVASFKRLTGDSSGGVQGGKMAHGMRSIGSAALNHALVASGSLDIYWEIGCWSAGIVIAQEAGCFVGGSASAPLDNDANEDILMGRKHIVVRAIGDTESEKGVDAQKRIIRDFYDTVEDYGPN